MLSCLEVMESFLKSRVAPRISMRSFNSWYLGIEFYDVLFKKFTILDRSAIANLSMQSLLLWYSSSGGGESRL